MEQAKMREIIDKIKATGYENLVDEAKNFDDEELAAAKIVLSNGLDTALNDVTSTNMVPKEKTIGIVKLALIVGDINSEIRYREGKRSIKLS